MHKYIDLNVLPRHVRGTNRNKIDWINSLGCELYFEYKDINGYLKILDFDKNTQSLKVKYKEKIKRISCYSLTKAKLGVMLDDITKDFKIEIGVIIKDEKRDLVIIDRKRKKIYKKDGTIESTKWYKYKCNKCGYSEGWKEESSLLNQKSGCPVCCPNPQTVIKGINDIATTSPEMIKYFVNKEDTYKYTKMSKKIVDGKCPDCGYKKKIRISDIALYGVSCPICSSKISYPERFMSNLLNQLNIEFIHQYSKSNVEWCDNYRYDFYIPKYNIIIETHGGQHYRSSGFRIKLEDQKNIDKTKRNLALNNNVYDYIELDCSKSNKNYIKEKILNSKLNKYLDLDKLDWNDIHRRSINNLVKEVCMYYDENKKHKTMQCISNELNINRQTLRKYLKIGSELGWCKYDPKPPTLKKQVKVVETKETFESINECTRKLGEMYNIKFYDTGISQVLRGRRKSYKGFHFEYVAD